MRSVSVASGSVCEIAVDVVSAEWVPCGRRGRIESVRAQTNSARQLGLRRGFGPPAPKIVPSVAYLPTVG
jgi:hypothetical protein